MINENLMEKIKEISLNNPNEEVCGFILNEDNIFPCKNSSIDVYSSFKISANDYIKATETGKITAVYHSHKNTEKFSDYDLMQCKAYKLPFLVFCNKNQKFNYIEPDKIINNPYVGRTFQLGTSDCYTLVEDFYKNEYNIVLPEFKRNDKWREIYKNLIDYYQCSGFKEVSDFKKGDIIILDMLNEGIGSHLAIYLGEDSILHHRRDWASNVIYYSPALKRKTLKVVRHQTL